MADVTELPVTTATARGKVPHRRPSRCTARKEQMQFGSEKRNKRKEEQWFPNPNPNWVKERTKEEGFGLEENQSRTLNP